MPRRRLPPEYRDYYYRPHIDTDPMVTIEDFKLFEEFLNERKKREKEEEEKKKKKDVKPLVFSLPALLLAMTFGGPLLGLSVLYMYSAVVSQMADVLKTLP